MIGLELGRPAGNVEVADQNWSLVSVSLASNFYFTATPNG